MRGVEDTVREAAGHVEDGFRAMENPFRDILATQPITRQRGLVRVPDKPGLGIEIDRSVIERFRVG